MRGEHLLELRFKGGRKMTEEGRVWNSEEAPEWEASEPAFIRIFIGNEEVDMIDEGDSLTAERVKEIARENDVRRFTVELKNLRTKETKALAPDDFPLTADDPLELIIKPIEKAG